MTIRVGRSAARVLVGGKPGIDGFGESRGRNGVHSGVMLLVVGVLLLVVGALLLVQALTPPDRRD